MLLIQRTAKMAKSIVSNMFIHFSFIAILLQRYEKFD